MTYIPTIGLEIHAELNTKSKMFCSSANVPLEQEPNVHICPVCMGHPGTLPVANQQAIQKMVRIGLALNCTIAEYSKFDRKSYFYPDLPKGYQISQYDMPLCSSGFLRVGERTIAVRRIHLEEDTGKLIHPEKSAFSYIDFNRAGVPLMELVTDPDIRSGSEARAFAQELQLILRYLNASDADMEKGQMRIEANVSVRPEGTETLGTKVEVKNLNSFRSVERAIAFEIDRQTKLLEAGERVLQETRGWNETKGETFSQREKEEAFEYRYFPEPDLPPLEFTQEEIESGRAELPELPQQKRGRLLEEYGLSEKEVEMLVANKELSGFFEHAVSELDAEHPEDHPKLIRLSVNYLLSDLLGILQGAPFKESKVTAENFAELILLIHEGKLASPAAKATLREMAATGADPEHVIQEKGFTQSIDVTALEELAQQVLLENPKAVEDYRAGKEASLKFLVGKLMAATRGAANPEQVQETLQKLLS